MNLLLVFIILNIINVVLQTIKSLATVKCGKGVAAIVNALAYGLYTIVIVMTNCELPLLIKALIVALTNLIGVYIVKVLEEKLRKDKLWHFTLTADKEKACDIITELNSNNLSYNYIDNVGKWTIFNIYSPTQQDSQIILTIAKKYSAKSFANETKLLM